MLEKEIRELLFLLQPPSLQVESLANMYMDRYGKPLWNGGLLIDGQQQGKARCSLTDVLMRLNTTRVIERFLVILFISASFTLDRCLFLRLHSHYDPVCFNFRQGHQYIVPVEDAPMYLAHGFKLGMPPASSNSNQIFVVFMPGTKQIHWIRCSQLLQVLLSNFNAWCISSLDMNHPNYVVMHL